MPIDDDERENLPCQGETVYHPSQMSWKSMAFPIEKDTVLTVGVFDGVHRGHVHVITQLMAESAQHGLMSGVVTFREHPRAVLYPEYATDYLTTLDDRLDLLKQTGVDLVVPITFDRWLSKLSAEDFISLLQKRLRMAGLVVGPDFAMGRNREGTIERLVDLAPRMGFTVTVVDGLRDPDGTTVHSTPIRDMLSQGEVERAAQLLGRRFTLEGVVVSGHGRGGPLGFPTANIEPHGRVSIPGDGVYAAFAHIRGKRMMAAVSIGYNPTFGDRDRAVEAFILDFDGDLYGDTLRLEFVRRLRDQVEYDEIEDLQEQVGIDVQATKRVLEQARVFPSDYASRQLYMHREDGTNLVGHTRLA